MTDQTYLFLAGGTVLVSCLHLFLLNLMVALIDISFLPFQTVVTIFASLLLSGLELSLRRQFQRKGFLLDFLLLAIFISLSDHFLSK
jgi:hypothetical protein